MTIRRFLGILFGSSKPELRSSLVGRLEHWEYRSPRSGLWVFGGLSREEAVRNFKQVS